MRRVAMQIAGVFNGDFDHTAVCGASRDSAMRRFVGCLCNRIAPLIRNSCMKRKVTGKDLTREAPRSPRIRVGGYAILGRTLDKCRALVAGNIGEYHFDCPLDNMLFGFKGVKGDAFKAQIEQGASEQEMVEWLNQSGEKKSQRK
jgi:hypothetical protein